MEKVGSPKGLGNVVQGRNNKDNSSLQKVEAKSCEHHNPRDNVWNHLHRKIMKITSQAKGKIDVSLQFGSQIYSYTSSDENCGCESSSRQGMEEAQNDSSLAVGQSKEQKGGCSESTERQKESPFCNIGDAESEPNHPKYRRTSRVPKWSGERRFLFLCSTHRAKFVCVTNDSSKSNGCSKIRWEILRIGEKKTAAFFLKKVSSLRFDDHNFKKKNLNQLENFHSMLTNCLEMLVLKRQHFKRPVFAVWTITRNYKEFT